MSQEHTTLGTCHGLDFHKVVRCYEEGGYYKAHGWSTSTGHGGGSPYVLTSGWEFDPGFSDKRTGLGFSPFTMIHLRKLIMANDEPSDEPETDVPVDEPETDIPTDIDIPTTLPGDGYEPSIGDGMSGLDIKPIHLIVIAVLIFLFMMLSRK